MAIINGTNNGETLIGTAVDDIINGFGGNDTIFAGAGNDVISGGTGDDTVYGGAGNDFWLADGTDSGNDTVYLEEGDDTAELGFLYPTLGSEIIDGGTGSDTFSLAGSAVTNFNLNATISENGTVTGNWITTATNFENLLGGNGNNILTGNSAANVINGGAGNDLINGGGGDDTLIAGDGFDTVNGGAGNDTIFGGGDNDVLNGGDDADTFIINTLGSSGITGTTVNGGSGGNDFDTLDITPLLAQGFEIQNLVLNPENNGQPGFNGQIQLYNPLTNTWANVNFTDIEEIIPCFTPGTMIATAEGEVPVETLKVGDRVMTRDNGLQTIRWVGRKTLNKAALQRQPELRPVRVAKGAMGQGLPERDMLVSPQHRLLVTGDHAALWFEDREVLVAALHMINDSTIRRADVEEVTYIHILFDQHEVVLSDGAWTESFQPGDRTLAGLDGAARNELLTLFPELSAPEGCNGYLAARRVLKRHEAALVAV
ncbi:Hint domain-containing protein [Vannielia sp. SX4]|uniref:Hint domain-containing protein n=1 Tax=Vannielia sp. SX4 TaxID=3463852 RepID=UPI00405916B9